MNKSCKFCWLISIALAVIVAGMAYKFIIVGNVVKSNDGRTALVLEAGERDLFLKEMRGFLEAVQTISEAVSNDDMKAAASAAKAVGMGSINEVPATLMAKLPLELKQLGLSTHKAFDDLGNEAEDMGDGKIVLKKLAKLMLNCTGCHAGYRLEAGTATK